MKLYLNREEEKALNAQQERISTKELENEAATVIQHAWLASIQATSNGLEGEDRQNFMDGRLGTLLAAWKSHRKDFMIFKSTSVNVDIMLEMLHSNSGKSRSKLDKIVRQVGSLRDRQEVMQKRQEKVEGQLVLLASRLNALARFFEKLG